jgi:hypothetical protein
MKKTSTGRGKGGDEKEMRKEERRKERSKRMVEEGEEEKIERE